MSSTDTKCVILAAGISTRLRPLTDELPKCLLEVNGNTLLKRMLDNLLTSGIQHIALVLGYRGEMVREYVKKQFPTHRFCFVRNPNYMSTNNAYSLLLARNFLENKEGQIVHPLLLLDSDILFSKELLPFFLKDGKQDIVSVRVSGDHNIEEIRVQVDLEGYIQLIGKHVPLEMTYGESIGIELFSSRTTEKLYKILEDRIRNDNGRNEFYESSFQEVIDRGSKLKAVDVSQFPSIEIDTLEDFERAQHLKVDS
jgi:choline kinase